MNKTNYFCLVFFITALICVLGYTTAGVAEETPETEETPIIMGIDLQDYSITVKVSEPFSYTLYKPEDPYRIVVELLNVSLGAFNNKIVSEKAGITEIVPSQVETPSLMARLDILLQMPSGVEPEYKENELTLRIEEVKEVIEEEAVLAEEEIVAEKEPGLIEAEEVPLPKATEVTDISFERSDDFLNIIIRGDGSMAPDAFPLDNRIIIDIPDVVMTAQLPSAVVSPLKGIRSGKHDGKIRLVLDLKEQIDFSVTAVEDAIVVALELPVAKRPVEEIEEIEVAEVEELEAPVAGKYTGKRISLDFQDADVIPIFRLLADISGYNVVVSPEVKGRITMKLINVPWDLALDIILKTFGLGKSVEDSIIRIAPHSVFARESEEAARAQEALVKAEPLESKVYFISYAKVSDVGKAIKDAKILTARGSVSADERTSSLFVNDVEAVFPKIEGLLATIDKRTPQVLIEARIVEVNTTDVKDLGIQWGFFLEPTGGRFGDINVEGSSQGFIPSGPLVGRNFLIDFPAGTVGAGTGSGIVFGLLNPAGTMGLDFRLSALTTLGRTKIIGSPKVVTLDNEKATISQGTSEPFPKVDVQSGQISADYKDVLLLIEVTPHITPAGDIGMLVYLKKEDVSGFVDIGGTDVPRTTKVEEATNVLIQSGETLVIGGVYKKTEEDSIAGVPGLMNIPVLGWLFKTTLRRDITTELLIFLTPRKLEKTI